MRWETKLAIWNSSRIVRTTHLVERTHTCFWQIKGVNFQFRMVTSETKNHIMHPFALLLFDWLMAVTLHCSLPLLATDQNANLQMPRFEKQITQMLLLRSCISTFESWNFVSIFLWVLTPFKSFWRMFIVLFLSYENLHQRINIKCSIQKLQFFVSKNKPIRTQLMILLIMQFKKF